MASTSRSTPTAPRRHRSPAARRRMLLVPAACALVVAFASACGSSGDTASAGTSSSASSSAAGSSAAGGSASMPATASEIMIQDFKYEVPASVAPGATVSVMNMDAEAHTITADEGDAFDVQTPPGKVVTFTAPTTPGSYDFHCTYHSNMHGTLVVK